jgi:hypothetical protein
MPTSGENECSLEEDCLRGAVSVAVHFNAVWYKPAVLYIGFRIYDHRLYLSYVHQGISDDQEADETVLQTSTEGVVSSDQTGREYRIRQTVRIQRYQKHPRFPA